MSNLHFQKKNKSSTSKKPIVQRSHPKQRSSPHTLVQRAQANPSLLTHDDVLQLQRELGNNATMKLLKVGQHGPANHSNSVQLRRKGGHIKREMFRGMGRGLANSWDVISGNKRRRINTDRAPSKPKLTLNQTGVPSDYWQHRLREKQQVQNFYTNYGNQAVRYRNLHENEDSSGLVSATTIMDNPMAYAIFKDHCDYEFSGENYLFVDLLKAPKKSMFASMVDRAQGNETNAIRRLSKIEALHIHRTMVEADVSPNEINISSSTRHALQSAIDKMNSSMGSSMAGQTGYAPQDVQTLFERAYDEIKKLLNDSYGRFASTDRYSFAMIALNHNEGGHMKTIGTKTKRWFGGSGQNSGDDTGS